MCPFYQIDTRSASHGKCFEGSNGFLGGEERFFARALKSTAFAYFIIETQPISRCLFHVPACNVSPRFERRNHGITITSDGMDNNSIIGGPTAKRILSPPIIACMAGLVIGLTPPLRWLIMREGAPLGPMWAAFTNLVSETITRGFRFA